MSEPPGKAQVGFGELSAQWGRVDSVIRSPKSELWNLVLTVSSASPEGEVSVCSHNPRTEAGVPASSPGEPQGQSTGRGQG